MKASYISAIVILLILLVGMGWYSLSLQRQVEDLNARNKDLQSALAELQKTISDLKNENKKFQDRLVQLDQERQQLAKKLDEIGVKISLLIDFGNGSRLWFNNTILPYGSSLLNATLARAQPVKYTVSNIGVFVDEIMDVPNSPPWYWLWWKFEGERWIMGETAADAAKLRNDGIYAWKYSDTSKWPPEPP